MRRFQVRRRSKPHRGFAKKAPAHPLPTNLLLRKIFAGALKLSHKTRCATFAGALKLSRKTRCAIFAGALKLSRKTRCAIFAGALSMSAMVGALFLCGRDEDPGIYSLSHGVGFQPNAVTAPRRGAYNEVTPSAPTGHLPQRGRQGDIDCFTETREAREEREAQAFTPSVTVSAFSRTP